MNGKWIKNPKWTWKTDLFYYLYYAPKEILNALIGIASKDHILNDMYWKNYLSLALSIADIKAGRWWTT